MLHALFNGGKIDCLLYKPAKIFADYQELLRDPDLDAAIVCLPNFLHFPASLAALKAGKHIPKIDSSRLVGK